ncbi:hypothetical protein [Paenibacillus lutrae]|uniref:Uncharacterized protein n=1 Tax=Paenibacillus lutrae TaxID=2078573 RepID=A0A7X3FHE3_9BACL|nr:hypothetical protein [Paenibacillus lutrae]MVO99695.1 hypothetical protein [Paenibacillus lutrae]
MMRRIGIMAVLSVSAASIASFSAPNSAYADAEALYRTGPMPNYWEHAGIRKAGSGVYEIKGYGYTVDLNSFTDFVGSETYLGPFTNPTMTATDKKNVLSTVAAMAADPDINYVGVNMIDWDANSGESIAPSEIDDIRCDGVVEYAYEWNNHWVWGRTTDGTKNGTPTNFDVSNIKYAKEHQNLGGDQPWFETSPLVQRGGAGTAWTKLRKTTTN